MPASDGQSLPGLRVACAWVPCVAATALSLAIAALLLAADTAHAAKLRIDAASRGRLALRVVGHVPRGALDFTVDHRRVRRTSSRAISVSAPARRAASDGRVRWRWIEVRRTRSKRLVARARFALAARRRRAAPTLVLLGAPRATTTKRTAVLRFRSSSRKVSCNLDGSRFRRCSSPVVHRDLSLGSHELVIRAKRRSARSPAAVTSIALETTILKPGSTPSDRGSGPVPPPAESPSPPGRTLVFQENFTGTMLNTAEWRPYDSTGNGGNGLRRPSAISLDGDGHLVIDSRMIDGEIVSGGLSHRRNYRYGWFEFRVRTEPDPTATMSGVVLTWPQSGRSSEDGENDIYETGTGANTRSPFYSFVHSPASDKQHYFRHEADAAQWHTMAMDWSAGAIRIYRDGALVWTLTDTSAIPAVAHHLCIQLDATATRALSQPVKMYVDWLRIYQ